MSNLLKATTRLHPSSCVFLCSANPFRNGFLRVESQPRVFSKGKHFPIPAVQIDAITAGSRGYTVRLLRTTRARLLSRARMSSNVVENGAKAGSKAGVKGVAHGSVLRRIGTRRASRRQKGSPARDSGSRDSSKCPRATVETLDWPRGIGDTSQKPARPEN